MLFRSGEVYWAQYRYTDQWLTVTAPTLSPASEVVAQGAVTACGNGLTAYADAFAAQSFAADALHGLMPHATQIAQLARIELARGTAVAARDAQPIYLRNKVALTTRERLAKVAS